MLIYFVVGEPSGDILASRLMMALRKKIPDIRFAGIGGETMEEIANPSTSNFKSLFPISDLSVMGFWEVVPRLPLIMKRMNKVADDIAAQRPDALVSVDSWGFVSKLLPKLAQRKVSTKRIHYVAPQVWAWKKGREKKAALLLDQLMCLLPFEPPLFERHGLPSTFVGHPVIETAAALSTMPCDFRERHNIPAEAPLLAVLPGSRHSEISKLAPVFSRVVKHLAQSFPDLHIVVPTVQAMADEVKAAFAEIALPCVMVQGQMERYQAFRAATFAIAASGTVSLELAACGTPHIIAYTFNAFTNFMIDRIATTRFANLLNILAGKFVVPEFVLSKCKAELIAPVVLDFMQHPDKAQELTKNMAQYLLQLQPKDMLPSAKAAETVITNLFKE